MSVENKNVTNSERSPRPRRASITLLAVAVSFVAGYFSSTVIENFGIFGSPQEEVKCVSRVNICVGSKAEYLDLDEIQKALGGPIELIYYGKNDRNEVKFIGPISALLKNQSYTSFDAQYSAEGKLYTFSISNGTIYKITSSSRITYP